MEESKNKNGGGLQQRPHPYNKANFLSKIFFTWLFPLFYKGFRKELTEEDMFPSLKKHDATHLGKKLEDRWQNQVENSKNPSLWKAIGRVFGYELLWLALLYALIELVVRLCQPFLISQLLKYYEPNTTMSVNEAYLYSSLIVCSPLVVMILQHNFLMFQLTVGVKIKVAATNVIYRKALRLSRYSLVETNVGQMVNLISSDVSRFEKAVGFIHNLWLAPLELLIIVGMTYAQVGITGIVGVIFLMLFIPFQMWLGKKTSQFRLNTAMRSDERIRLMNEIIMGIQVIKMYAWEKPFAKLVEISRWKEMQQIKRTSMIRAAVQSFHLFVNKIAIYASIVAYVLTGNMLNANYVYVMTSFFSILRNVVTRRFPEAVTNFAEVQISVRRIREFLMREEIANVDKHNKMYSNRNADYIIQLTDVHAKWNKSNSDYSLEQVSLSIPSKVAAVVIGPVGGGKTTLLQAILRELPPVRGEVTVQGSISYCSQEPWLFMANIRQNILFGEEFDERRYWEVIYACALERDLSQLPYGDQTLIGDRGVSLSGGQKARINLARAVYKKADIYLLDDPLSAVDTHVGRHLFDECIEKFLKDKCLVLVTHQLQFLKNAQNIHLIDNGKIHFSGNYQEIEKCSHDYAKLLVELNNKPEDDQNTVMVYHEVNRAEIIGVHKNKEQKLHKETKQVGNVKMSVYRTYFQNGGHWCKSMGILLLFVVAQGMASLSDYFITWWVNAEILRSTFNSTHSTASPFEEFWLNHMTFEVSILIYSSLIILLIILALTRSIYFYKFALKASTTLHNNMFDKIVYATMRFFNTNPSGRILNRFSHDMNQVDESLPNTMINTVQNGLTVIFNVFVVVTVNPWMLIPTIVILTSFYYMRIVYIATSQDVKRIESVTRSPVYSHLTASLQGLTTIRAFGAQDILIKEFNRHQNRNSSPLITFIAVGRTFGFWLDAGCIIYIFLTTFSFLFIKSETLGGFVGLSITQALTLTGMFQMCMRNWSELENQMTCVERIKEYVDVKPENDSSTSTPHNWPQTGEILFSNVYLKYAPEEPPILKNLNFLINAKEKVGVVGRTGAGKSSLIIALFRLAENEGFIEIDGVDTKGVKLEFLRSSISIIPQEPVLFSGTLRKNLDPFDEYDDEILWKALDQVEMKSTISDLAHGLESNMSEGGTNFSVGQRQLVCLARAIIRHNKILVMDEATANVDPQTDALIQKTIREKFEDCTVITIAHRLQTIVDSNKILVMDGGRVVEFGTPLQLMENKGVFWGMVEKTGSAMARSLREIAEKSDIISAVE